MKNDTGRFAPSTTGPAHPGTLLSALLCWLDARSREGRVVLRLEDLDPDRSQTRYAHALARDLDWLGLDFDAVEHQTATGERHTAALDRLADAGRLYPCRCSRRDLRRDATRAVDGGVRYPGTCRERPLPSAGWRATSDALRVALPDEPVIVEDEGGEPLGHDPLREMGDPVVRRRDGSIAYHLASVVDDAAIGVTRVVRGRDLAGSTTTQVALQRLLGLPEPRYRHHLLLLEPRGNKLAKLHGSIALDELRAHFDATSLCGELARAAGLRETPTPTTPTELLEDFRWDRVGTADRTMRWTGGRLTLDPEDG